MQQTILEIFNEAIRSNRRIYAMNLVGANLHGIICRGLCGDDIKFSNADLTQSDFSDTHLKACDFSRANASNIKLVNATLRLVNLSNAVFINANCENVRIEDSTLNGVDFTGANLRHSFLTESTLLRAVLCRANMDSAEGDGVGFRGADLTSASLVNSKLMDADFRGADLTDANLSDGDFCGADFRGALLENVRWHGANLSGALFDSNCPDVAAAENTKNRDPVNSETDQINNETIDATDLFATFSELVTKSISGASKGSIKLDGEMEKLTRQLTSWHSNHGDIDVNDLSSLLSSFEHEFKNTDFLPVEQLKNFSVLLQSLENAGDTTPPVEWQKMIEKLLPGLLANDEESLEILAQVFQQGRKN